MRFASASLYLLFTLATAVASDWPQWRGPHRDGLSPETGLLTRWPAAGPRLLYEMKGAGRGYSSLASVGGKVYTVGDTLSTETDEKEYLVCFNGETGKLIWKARLGEPFKHSNAQWESSRSTPTVDGEHVYILTGNGEVVCLEVAGGREVWRKSLPDDFGGKKGDGWGYSESILIEGDKVVCTPGGDTTLLALDKLTGKTVWKSTLPEKPGAGHASIVLSDIGGTRVGVQTTAGFGLGFRVRDGKILWTVENFRSTAVIPTPIVRGDLVLLAAGYNFGGTLLRQAPEGDGVKVTTIYPPTKTLANKHGGLVLVGDYVYGDTEDRGMPFCVEFLTGKEKWKKRGAGGSMSLISAEGLLYMHYANGTVVLAKASPEDYQVISSFKIPHSGDRPDWSHPIIADGKLFVRSEDSIRCYDIKGGSAGR
jgi:outer membrane protein assembly factor BamB